MEDLFMFPEHQPKELRKVLEKYEALGDSLSYIQLAEMLKEVEGAGFTFDYYLDAVPYDLRPIGNN